MRTEINIYYFYLSDILSPFFCYSPLPLDICPSATVSPCGLDGLAPLPPQLHWRMGHRWGSADSISLDIVIGSGKATWLTPNQWDSVLGRSRNSWEAFFLSDVKPALVICAVGIFVWGEPTEGEAGAGNSGARRWSETGPTFYPMSPRAQLARKAVSLEFQLGGANKYPYLLQPIWLGFPPLTTEKSWPI